MPTSTQTFLFADLVGFTALAELKGDARALEAALELQRVARGLLGEYRTEQVKTLGDALMLRSATPEDAIRLGVRLLDDLADDPDSLPLRVGIHTGPALSSDGDWYGKTVNVAARLCSVAPPGEVIVSDATRSAAGALHDIVWDAPTVHRLRNVSEPIVAHRARAGSRSMARKPARRRALAWPRRPLPATS